MKQDVAHHSLCWALQVASSVDAEKSWTFNIYIKTPTTYTQHWVVEVRTPDNQIFWCEQDQKKKKIKEKKLNAKELKKNLMAEVAETTTTE